MDKVDPQEKLNQRQEPGHLHGYGRTTRGHWPQMPVFLSSPALVCLSWPVQAELISKRTGEGDLHKSHGGRGAAPPLSAKPPLGGWGQLH